LLDFSANINPLGAPAAAIEAGEEALRREVGRYPDLYYPKLREALAGYLCLPPEMVLPTNGGAEALFLAARAAADDSAGGKALILEPTFSEYAAAARAAGFEISRVVTRRPETGFRLDLTILDEALGDPDGIGLVFLCNPNNPTGDATPREEVLRMAERVRAVGAFLVVDEAFVDFAPELSIVPEVDEFLFVARSFTKFFAVPGLRLGCLLARDTEHARSFQPSWPVNGVAAAVGVAATKDAAFTKATLAEVGLRRRELFSALRRMPGMKVYSGAANFLLVRGPETLAERLAGRGVLIRSCEPFPGLGPGFFRVAVRTEEENAQLVKTLEGVLEGTP
jgi:threonine-phosphate decarboxylase